jgi:hypothetical protein
LGQAIIFDVPSLGGAGLSSKGFASGIREKSSGVFGADGGE